MTRAYHGHYRRDSDDPHCLACDRTGIPLDCGYCPECLSALAEDAYDRNHDKAETERNKLCVNFYQALLSKMV